MHIRQHVMLLQSPSDGNWVSVCLQPDSSKDSTELFRLLYSHASHHFQQQAYAPASKFFSAAYMYAEEGAKARTARVLSMCNIGIPDLPRSV